MFSKKFKNFFLLSKVSSNAETLLTFKKKIEKIHGEKLIECPRCKIKMEKLKKEDVFIDVCKKCGGMWLDKGEIEKLVKIAQKMRGGKVGKK